MAYTEREWLAAIGRAAEAIGGGDFLARLAGAFATLARHDIVTVVRYARFSKPEYLLHRGAEDEMVARYLATYYQFDPFYRYWRERERPGVVTLGDVASTAVKQGRYVRDFLRESRISDEVGMFLPALGRASIALFLDRAGGRYTAREVERARAAYPLLAGLHKAHVNATLAALGNGAALGLTRRPTLITDRDGATVHANRAWRERAANDPAVAAALDAMKAGAEVALPGNAVLHGEPLGDDVFLAPGGRIHTLEDVAQSPATISPRQAAALYRDVLTPRECEVVALIFEGHPTFTIAQRLGLSIGTVKNHRRRLYRKLDITTERELFLLYIEALSRVDGTA